MAGANGGFGTHTAMLQKAETDIQSCHSDINGYVSTLTAQLEPLKAQWKGQAATAFNGVWERWSGDMGKINSRLLGLGDKVGLASGHYKQTDVTQQQEMSNVMKALG